MDKNHIYITNLYDYYNELLTEKQRNYFEDYYMNNLTLAEIAENNHTSRNAIHKQIKETENKLNNYEQKLKLYDKNIKIKEMIMNIDPKLKEKIEELI